MNKRWIMLFVAAAILTSPFFVRAADITDYTYSGDAFNYTSQTASAFSLAFSSDGTSMYLSNTFTGTNVYQYTLSTAWDITTATYTRSKSLPHNGIVGLAFSSDGSKMYSLYFYSREVYEYDLSTPWDVSTASTTATLGGVSAGNTYGFAIGDSGTKIYLAQSSNPYVIRQYNMASAYDLSTADSTADATLTLGASDGYYISGIAFTSDGTKMYLMRDASGSTNSSIRQYTLSTPWDVSTAVFDTGEELSTASQSDGMNGMALRSSTNDIYAVGVSSGAQRVFFYESGEGSSGSGESSSGRSKRLVTPPVPHIEVYGVTPTAATIAGAYQNYDIVVDTSGLEYGEADGVERVTFTRAPHSFRYVARELECNTRYTARAYTTNSIGTSYSDEYTFKTENCAEGEDDVVSKEETVSAQDDTETLRERLIRQIRELMQRLVMRPQESLVEPVSAAPSVRNLTVGDEGDDVRMLQEILISANAGPIAAELARVGASGHFGTYTQNALSEYQQVHGIQPPDGYFGPLTRDAMKERGVGWW